MRPRGNNQHRDAGPRVARLCARAFVFALALGLVASCRTTDSLGFDLPLKPLKPPSVYPNPFKDHGHSDADIAAKINAAFMQLFHGDATTQAIYVVPPGSTGMAYINDVLHNDKRTEGIGLGMLIAVELGHRDEFDNLWTYAKSTMRVPSGPAAGYFNSFCDDYTGASASCLDPFGLQQMTMALILAHDAFTTPGRIDYATDARELLTLIQYKVVQNGSDVTDTFDDTTHLVFDVPNTSAAGVGRPSIEMPGYYELWAQATGDSFWTDAATAGRAYWRRTANPTTGFTPIRATFAGVAPPNYGVFSSEAYRAQIAMALDQIWVGGNGDGWNPGEADRLLGFFASLGPAYGMSFGLDGSVINQLHDPALVAANGVSAAIATIDQRTGFVDSVWNMDIPSMVNRYFAGLLYLISLLVLGGQMHVL